MSKEKHKSHNAMSRRDALKTTAIAGLTVAASAVGFKSHEERCLANIGEIPVIDDSAQTSDATKVDAVSGATRTSFNVKPQAPLNEKVPLAQIGDLTISRIILGGNLIGGYAHSRDLIYVSDLIKAYHTEQKCIETFLLAEECGINAFLGDWNQGKMMENYWKWTDGKIQLISQCTDDLEVVKRTIDCGSIAVYPQGETCDRLVREENFDKIEKIVTMIRDAKLPVGLGAHHVSTLQAILDKGIVPDFWMKTYHPLDYWSAQAATEHDNIFCRKPEATRDFFAKRPEPWIAFKTLAAGAVRPQQGFRYALEGGADFLCVGMYDFQIVDDVNIYTDIVKTPLQRSRRMIENIDREKYEAECEEKEDA